MNKIIEEKCVFLIKYVFSYLFNIFLQQNNFLISNIIH